MLIYLETAEHWSECSFGRLWFWGGEFPALRTPLTCLNQTHTHTHILQSSAVSLRLHDLPLSAETLTKNTKYCLTFLLNHASKKQVSTLCAKSVLSVKYNPFVI